MASGFLHTSYKPERVQILVNAVPLLKFADGTFVEVSYREPRTNLIVGSGGDSVTSFTADRSGTLAVTLQYDSPSVSILEALIASKTFMTIAVSDLNTGSNYVANKCTCSTYPSVGFGATPESRVYEFHFPVFLPVPVGGTNVTGF
jgi:hypothetical protein